MQAKINSYVLKSLGLVAGWPFHHFLSSFFLNVHLAFILFSCMAFSYVNKQPSILNNGTSRIGLKFQSPDCQQDNETDSNSLGVTIPSKFPGDPAYNPVPNLLLVIWKFFSDIPSSLARSYYEFVSSVITVYICGGSSFTYISGQKHITLSTQQNLHHFRHH